MKIEEAAPERPDTLQGTSGMVLAIKLGVIHALVDAGCAATVFAEVALGRLPYKTLLALVILYNSFAFGSQWLVGFLADLRSAYRSTAAAGTLLIAAAAIAEPSYPWTGVVLAGIGNACFHVGAGAAVLRASYGRGAESGIFVGPGALGLVTGLWLGVNSELWRLPITGLLLCSCLVLPYVIPSLDEKRNRAQDTVGLFRPVSEAPRPGRPCSTSLPRLPAAALWLALPVALLLGSVAVRSTVGGLLSGFGRTSALAAFGLGAAAMTGKCIGGLLSDRFGWRISSTLALLLAAPLVAAGMHSLDGALSAMFIFQFTMPVTLAAVYVAFPGGPVWLSACRVLRCCSARFPA